MGQSGEGQMDLKNYEDAHYDDYLKNDGEDDGANGRRRRRRSIYARRAIVDLGV